MKFVKFLTRVVLLLLLKFFLYIYFIIIKREGHAPPYAYACTRLHGSSSSRSRDEARHRQGGSQGRQGGA